MELFQKYNARNPIDELNLNELHATIIGQEADVSFENLLTRTPRDLVDEVDIAGRTPLFWAASLGKTEVVKSLLQKGADPDKTDFGGRTPLRFCGDNLDCVIALLEAGANVNHQDACGNTLLLNLCLLSNVAHHLEVLDRFQPDLNRRAINLYTALHTAVERRCPSTTHWLLRKGADVNARGPSGQTPLLTAIEGTSPEEPDEFEHLLERTNLKIIDVHCESLLHYVARFGSIKLISMTRQASLSGLDVGQRSTRGFAHFESSIGEKTAMEIAEWRRDYNAEWSKMHLHSPDVDPQAWFAAFEDLIDSIQAR